MLETPVRETGIGAPIGTLSSLAGGTADGGSVPGNHRFAPSRRARSVSLTADRSTRTQARVAVQALGSSVSASQESTASLNSFGRCTITQCPVGRPITRWPGRATSLSHQVVEWNMKGLRSP